MVRALPIVILVLVSVNPYVEELNGKYAYTFMFSHYALFLAGMLLGMWFLRWPRYLWLLGALPVCIWHFPVTFSLSGQFLFYRAFEEATIFLGGILVGSNLWTMTQKLKVVLFVLWIIVDSALSAVFIVDPASFSSIPGSPFSSIQFILTGIAMALFMNFILAYLLYRYFRRLHRIQRDLAKSYQ